MSSFMKVVRKSHGHLMPPSFKVKPSGVQPRDIQTQKFHLLPVVLFCKCVKIKVLGLASSTISCVWPNILAPDS